MNRFFLLWLLALIFCAGCAKDPKGQGQVPPEKSLAKQQVEWELSAYEAFDRYDYTTALNLYQKLDSIDPGNPGYIYPLGICYLYQEDPRALTYLEACLDNEDRYPPNLKLYMGTAYHNAHRLNKAIEYYTKYKSIYEGRHSKEDRKIVEDMETEIRACLVGLDLMQDSLPISIVNLGPNVNSFYPEYAPLITADERTIIFTSERDSRGTEHFIDVYDRKVDEDIYISHLSDAGEWGAPEPLDSINSDGQEATVSLTPDGHTMLIYRYTTDLLHANSGDLYISRLKGEHWTKPEALPSNINGKSWEPSGSLSPDGRILVFSSDRKGGFGGTDIYSSHYLGNGYWSEPENLGPTINSPEDEDSPYLHPDGRSLYFCSKGHRTMGGFDIFMSTLRADSSWSAPQNLGYPINTARDDIHFSWTLDGQRIYFSSLREGGMGEKDLYMADMSYRPAKKVVVKSGQVLDSLSDQPVEATLTVRDRVTGEVKGVYTSNQSTGNFTLVFTSDHTHALKVEAQGYETVELDLHYHTNEEFYSYEQNIRLVPSPTAGVTTQP